MTRASFPTHEILRLLRETEMTVSEIAEKAGCTTGNITIRIKNHLGLTPSQYRLGHGWVGSGDGQRAVPPAKVEEIVDLYRQGYQIQVVAERTGVGRGPVARVLHAKGIEIRHPATYLKCNLPEEEIVRRYQAGENCVEMGREYGCHEKTIRLILENHGVSRRQTSAGPEPMFLGERAQEIARRYEEGETSVTLSEELGCTPWTIIKTLRRLKVEVRAPGRVR